MIQGDNEEGVQQLRLPYRRSRKDELGRDYICGCGKKYLSYPALYTHIKTKHNGIQPEGTQKTVVNMPRRIKPKIDEQIFNLMLKLLEKKDLSILNQLTGNYEGSVPLLQRIRRNILPQNIYTYFNNYMIKIQSLKLTKSSPVDLILISFLMNVGQFISESLYVYFLYFVKIIRNCFYQHGQEVFQLLFHDKMHQLQAFNTHQCRYLPVISDFMIRYYAPLQYPEIQINILSLIVYDFCKWMNKIKLTDLCVNFKKSRKNDNETSSWRNIPEIKRSLEKDSDARDEQSEEHSISDEDPESNRSDLQKDKEDSKNQKDGFKIPKGLKSKNSKEKSV